MTSLKKMMGVVRKRRSTENLEAQLDEMARQLCTHEEVNAQLKRQQWLSRRGINHVRLFPIWRRYRWQAHKVLRIQEFLPILKHLPLGISVFIGELIYQ